MVLLLQPKHEMPYGQVLQTEQTLAISHDFTCPCRIRAGNHLIEPLRAWPRTDFLEQSLELSILGLGGLNRSIQKT